MVFTPTEPSENFSPGAILPRNSDPNSSLNFSGIRHSRSLSAGWMGVWVCRGDAAAWLLHGVVDNDHV
jgi:hypothetical protein